MTIALVALGSNLGKRQLALRQALVKLGAMPRTQVEAVATFRQTTPVDCPPDMPAFINSAARLNTALEIHKFFDQLRLIEKELGRERGQIGLPEARTIDLDLIFFGSEIVSTMELILPHPRMHERLFVLEPLAEIAPDFRHPVLGQTVLELLHKAQMKNGGRLAG